MSRSCMILYTKKRQTCYKISWACLILYDLVGFLSDLVAPRNELRDTSFTQARYKILQNNDKIRQMRQDCYKVSQIYTKLGAFSPVFRLNLAF